MALLSNIAGTEQVALTKINACINTVNLFGGGTAGKIATKSSSNDFDIYYANNAFNQKSTTSITIGTGTKNFDIGGSQWDDDFNFRVKAFSIASPGNYMEGTISALISGYGVKTWAMEVDTVVGSGTFADWQFQVLRTLDTETIQVYCDDDSLYPNQIFISAPEISGGTLSKLNTTLIRQGKQVTIQGCGSAIASGTSFNRRLRLGVVLSKWEISEGSNKSIFGTANVMYFRSGLPYSFAMTLTNGSIDDQYEHNSRILEFDDNNVSFASVNLESIDFNFSITYLIQ